MSLHFRFILLFFLILISYISATDGYENLFVEETVQINLQAEVYQLARFPIVALTETVFADEILLYPDLDYVLDFKSGRLTLLKSLPAQHLFLSYITVPASLSKPIYSYEKRAYSDSLFVPRRRLNPLWAGDDGKLNISGSKTFALTFSDDDTFDLKQSLYVNLNGELADNINILAQLSDSQSKLSPEGDSKELSSLDQVFIKVYGKQYELAMGDLDWEFANSKYMIYQTKFEGVNVWYKDTHAFQAAYSASNGKRSTQRLSIIDGKQGPYYLSAGAYQQNFIVIAGSEKVYQDGTLLERGLDYSIDYSEGSIMFKRLVTSSNNISVMFQYSDENYKQSMYLNSSLISITDRLSLRHHLIHQSDDKNSPLQYEFSAADLDSLRAAGDSEVWGEGIFEVDPGAGNYIRLIGSDGLEYYQYSPYDSTAAYNIVFSYVGFGNGSYSEYSSGKYQFVGMGNGSWQPQKRIIPPGRKTNINSRLDYNTESVDIGVETLYSHHDRNTLSSIDDGDNDSYIIYAFGQWKPDWDRLKSTIKLDFENRAAHSFLFGTYYDPASEFQFSSIDAADSLAQMQGSLDIRSETSFGWRPQLLLRYKTIDNLYDQKAVRLSSFSPATGFWPQLTLQSTIAEQVYADSTLGISTLEYYQGSILWKNGVFQANLDALLNSLTYKKTSTFPGTRYAKLSPSLMIGNQKKTVSTLTYIYDENSVKIDGWEPVNTSDVYRLRHTSAFTNHNLDLDFTHRKLKSFTGDNANSNYDLVTMRSSHNFWKQALAILANYQLNQTEFYPRIRELEFVGTGQGLYDSTGVYIPDGDYDYVYITSELGTLSTEINGQLNLYLKPAYLSAKPLWQRIMTDIVIQATEQSGDNQGYGHYIFLPGSVYNSEKTIYGRQNFQQTIWLDLMRNKISSLVQYELNRSIDQRYQTLSRTYYDLKAAEIELKQFYSFNFRFRFENRFETDSRYGSEIVQSSLGSRIQRNLNNQTAIQADIDASTERGDSSFNDDSYELNSISLRPSIRSVLMQKYRVSASMTGKYNDRKGSDYLSFLPDKRAGFIALWNLQAIYRLNAFTSATIEYSGTSYPKDRARHQLKIEFKAEL